MVSGLRRQFIIQETLIITFTWSITGLCNWNWKARKGKMGTFWRQGYSTRVCSHRSICTNSSEAWQWRTLPHPVHDPRRLRRLPTQSWLYKGWLHFPQQRHSGKDFVALHLVFKYKFLICYFFFAGVSPTSGAHTVRTIHRQCLPLLRQRFQHDCWCLRLQFDVPPLPWRQCQGQDWMSSFSFSTFNWKKRKQTKDLH